MIMIKQTLRERKHKKVYIDGLEWFGRGLDEKHEAKVKTEQDGSTEKRLIVNRAYPGLENELRDP